MKRRRLEAAMCLLRERVSFLSYDEIIETYLDHPTAFEFQDGTGRTFTAEINAEREDDESSASGALPPLRLFYSVDDGGLSALFPWAESLLVSPPGPR